MGEQNPEMRWLQRSKQELTRVTAKSSCFSVGIFVVLPRGEQHELAKD